MTASDAKPAGPDYLAYSLLAFALLNLNGIAHLLTNVKAMFSLTLALPVTLYLLVRYTNLARIGPAFSLFILFFLAFLIGSIFPYFDGQRVDLGRWQQYAITALMVTGVYMWAVQLDDWSMTRALRAAKYFLLFACVATINSPMLASYFSYKLGTERASGFFQNPNEAAIAALYCFILVAVVPARSTLFNAAQFAIAVVALATTFSRSGFLILLVLVGLYMLRRPSIKSFVWIVVGAVVIAAGFWSVFEYDLFNLNIEQRRRLSDVLSVVTGEFADASSGGRGELTEIAMSRIKEIIPWGAGIGQFHHMEYGIRAGHDANIWLGVHNTYLMILGEAGLLALVAFLGMWAVAIWCSIRSPFRVFAVGCSIVMMLEMLSSHAVLGQRFHNVILALILAVAAREKVRSPVRLPLPVPQT